MSVKKQEIGYSLRPKGDNKKSLVRVFDVDGHEELESICDLEPEEAQELSQSLEESGQRFDKPVAPSG